jgi:hypothetical protein
MIKNAVNARVKMHRVVEATGQEDLRRKSNGLRFGLRAPGSRGHSGRFRMRVRLSHDVPSG